jgi:hypothetical protein
MQRLSWHKIKGGDGDVAKDERGTGSRSRRTDFVPDICVEGS